MSLLDTTAFTQPGKPVVPEHVAAFTNTGLTGQNWHDFEPDEIAMTLAEMGRHLNGKTESATLLVGQEVGRLLRADYASLERRVMAHYASGDLDWPRLQSGDPVKACTRLMDRVSEWWEFARRVEHPDWFDRQMDSWFDLYDAQRTEWAKFVRVVSETPETEVEDARGKRPKFDPPPEQTTGAEALAMWRMTAGFYG